MDAEYDLLLARLPAELLEHILCTSSVEDLPVLVNASRTLRHQYLCNRRYIILKAWSRSLEPLTKDAAALIYSKSAPPHESNKAPPELFRNYSAPLDGWKTLPELDLQGVVEFHASCIIPVRDAYIDWVIPNLSAYTKSDGGGRTLTSTEEVRVTRALYRLQICCETFGKPEWTSLHGSDIMDCIATSFQSWESEEILCVYSCISVFYRERLREIHRHIKRQPTPLGEEFLQETEDFGRGTWDWIHSRLCAGGLQMLTTLMTMQDDQTILQFLLSIWKADPAHLYLDQVIVPNQVHPTTTLIERSDAIARRPSHPFAGDSVDQPPLAWTTIWRDTASSLTGTVIPSSLRWWGYIMWDAARLRSCDGVRLVKRHWSQRPCDNWGIFDDEIFPESEWRDDRLQYQAEHLELDDPYYVTSDSDDDTSTDNESEDNDRNDNDSDADNADNGTPGRHMMMTTQRTFSTPVAP